MDKQRALTFPFIVFATGFALAVYALFVVACDLMGLSLGVFRMLGMNPLLAYIVHHAVEGVVHLFTPEDSPLWYVLAMLAAFYAITLLVVRFFDTRKIYLRL
jgi:hypothetical protein